MENLLTQKPECHRELFTYTKGSKSAKESYTFKDLSDYYAVSFYPGSFYGNFATVAQMAALRQKAIGEAPEWEDTDKEKLINLVKKYGLEIILYAIDLVDGDGYPKVESIKECIPDAEIALANLIRNRDYGI